MKPKKPKRFHPVVSVLMAVALLGLAGSMGFFAVESIERDAAPFPKKHGPFREVTKDKQPAAFYFAVGFYAVTSVITSVLGLMQLREAKLWISEQQSRVADDLNEPPNA